MAFGKIAKFVFLNGKIVSKSKAKISVLDSGFLNGLGVYEVWRAFGGKIHLFEENLAELSQGLKIMEISFRWNARELETILLKLLKRNKLINARIRLTATKENVLIELSVLPKTHKQIRAFSVFLKRSNPRVKSIDWLATVFCLRKGDLHRRSEAILVNSKGEISEGAQSNIFLFKNGKLFTPLENTIHPGAARKWVLQTAKQLGIPTQESKLNLQAAFRAEEIFTTGSISGIRAITFFDKHKIGDGKIGKTTKLLQKEFANSLTKIP
ncbi:MAG: aminotransferase class IV [Candidatus Gracilibacteria bacterium]|jgi:branched-subunit amino acid aminotransferase/4-amino-4-deoxychorismate lyase